MAQRYPAKTSARPARRGRGFTAMSGLIQSRVKGAGEKRGFAVMRLLTHWPEIVGPDLAAIATPVKMGYASGGLGGTLTILVSGANAPMVQMELPRIRERVNGCYGYNAVSRVVITQTAPTGFERGKVQVTETPDPQKASPEICKASAEMADGVEDEGLRSALDRLARNVLTRQGAKREETP